METAGGSDDGLCLVFGAAPAVMTAAAVDCSLWNAFLIIPTTIGLTHMLYMYNCVIKRTADVRCCWIDLPQKILPSDQLIVSYVKLFLN
jgi:hypothetical protein